MLREQVRALSLSLSLAQYERVVTRTRRDPRWTKRLAKLGQGQPLEGTDQARRP